MSKGFTIWFTGLPSSGKSALTNRLAEIFKQFGMSVEVLDGDVVRRSLSKGLGFSKEDRNENVRRIGHVCSYMAATGRVAIAAFIAPYKNIRMENRQLIDDYVEVYCKCSVEECARRDPKGLYKKAFAGEIKGFTGVDDPYEVPENPEVVVNTEFEDIDESLEKIVTKLQALDYIPRPDGLNSEDEEKIKRRLEDLGYL